MVLQHIQPGDATFYTLFYGVERPTAVGWPRLVFGFGEGNERGTWLSFPVMDIPNFSFSYFESYMKAQNTHTAQVAFTILLALVGQPRYVSDSWEREAELNWDFLADLPSLGSLIEADRKLAEGA